jgi:two-component system, OmpR family, response regulator
MNSRPATRILVVDDEPAVRSALRRGLEAEGYAVSEAGGKAELLQCLAGTPVDLITLDLLLAGEDGLEIAQEVRSKKNIPIIMITGRSAPVDRVAGLDHGADDYITKPFHFREVLIRVANVLQRYEAVNSVAEGAAVSGMAEKHYAFETGVVDLSRRRLVATDGSAIDLTDAEFDLLAIFLRRPTRILSRDEIMMLLRGKSWSPLDRTIDGHIARLRKKIDPLSETPRLIKSVRNVGYVFTGSVRRV